MARVPYASLSRSSYGRSLGRARSTMSAVSAPSWLRAASSTASSALRVKRKIDEYLKDMNTSSHKPKSIMTSKTQSRSYSRKVSRPVKKQVKFVRKRNKKGKMVMKKVVTNVVHDVMKCQTNVGVYKKIVGGDVDSTTGAVGAGTNNSHLMLTGFRKWGANAGTFTVDATRFTPLSAKRILDASSVLFNGKLPAVDWENATDNFNVTSLKVEVDYASYALTLKNCTEWVYDVTCYELTNKSSSQVPALDTIHLMVGSGNQNITSSPAVIGFQSVAGVNHSYVTPLNLNFSDIRGVNANYSIKVLQKKRVGVMEEIQYKTSRSKYCVEFSKHLYESNDGSGGSGLATYAKGEKQIIFAFTPILHLAHNNSNNHSASLRVDAGVNLHTGWAVKVEEYFKILEPDGTADANQGEKVKLFQSIDAANNFHYFPSKPTIVTAAFQS